MASTKANGALPAIELTPRGATLHLETPAGSATVTSRLAGEVNILNLLAALTAAHARGVPFSQLVAAAPTLMPVPGRFQPVDAGQPFTVIVDYAHTDDALRNLLALARQMTAKVRARASSLSSAAAATATAPSAPKWGRPPAKPAISSSPQATTRVPKIRSRSSAEVEPGLRSTGVEYIIEPDRATAIHIALAAAKPRDVVLLAGKGHEKEQILADRTIPFDDAEIARSTLSALGYTDSSHN